MAESLPDVLFLLMLRRFSVWTAFALNKLGYCIMQVTLQKKPDSGGAEPAMAFIIMPITTVISCGH